MKSKEKKSLRNSGIELTKVLAILFIIISHVVESLMINNGINPLIETYDYTVTSTNINHVIISLLYYLGVVGNAIFIWSSAYFLSNDNKIKKDKAINMILTNFIIYFIFLILSKYLGYNISNDNILRLLMPTLFELNWFITAYIILYLIHPLLNIIIKNINKRLHLCICIFLIIFYSLVPILRRNLLYSNGLTDLITIYFIVSFTKKYLSKLEDNKKLNIIILITSIVLLILQVFILNILGNNIDSLHDNILQFKYNTNIINILIAMSTFNIFKTFKFKSKIINYISSLSLLVYIIHENYISIYAFRPIIWNYIYKHFTYKYIVIETIIYSICLFIICIIISSIFKETIGKLINIISNKLSRLYSYITDKSYKLIDNKLK